MKKIGGLKKIHALPRRHASKKVPSYTQDSILVENLEELFDLSIQDIAQPLDQLGPKSPIVHSPISSPPQSPPQTPCRIMVGKVNQPTWRVRTPLNLAPPLHDLPKHPERTLPKFDLGKGISVEDHLKSFFFSLERLRVQHEDVACRIFPHTFEPKENSCFLVCNPIQ